MRKRLFLILTIFLCYINNSFGYNVLQPIDIIGNNYSPLKWEEIDSIHLTSLGDKVNIELEDINGSNYCFDLDEYYIYSGKTVPLIVITTEELMEEIPDKINYQTANISISGFGDYKDFEGEVQIRGRGNTSWIMFPKKPYRLKFEKKQELCGLKKAKSFVLTANWTDVSLMQNPIASFIGKMLDLPFTHTMIPVDVIFNGSYRGSYLLTNKPGINSGSVDIDEDTSVMWELDNSYDEDMKFKSPIYNLPVMLSDPDMDEERFEYWKQDFIEMERAVSEGNIEDWIDLEIYAKYRIIYDIMYNKEIGHPKSVKIYKT